MRKACCCFGEVPYFKVTWDINSPILTRIERFRTVTLVRIHRWLWNNAQSLRQHRCALLIFKVIHQISRLLGIKKNRSYQIPQICLVQGHPWNFKVTRDKYRWFWAELSVSGLSLQFEFTDGFEMIYKAWSSIEEVPYCLSRTSIKFQGHTVQKIANFDPNWAFLDCSCSLNSPMCLKWCTRFDIVQKRCPIVFRGHPSYLKVTWTEISMVWIQF